MTAALSAPPTAPKIRHDLIDALRGFALAGVLLVNLVTLSLYELLPTSARESLPGSNFDAMVLQAVAWLVNVKFITLFTLLFGVGFAMQLERASVAGSDGIRLYVRRVCVLLGIGLLHSYFVWWGDILLTYAVVALLLVPFRHASDRTLLVAGVAIAMLPPVLSPWMRELLPVMPKRVDLYAQGLLAFAGASWSETLHANMALAQWARVSNWALVCFVLARFLLGYWAGRRGLLQFPERHLPLLRAIFYGAVLMGIATTVLSAQQAQLRDALPPLQSEPGRLLIRMLVRLGPLSLGIAYAAGFALLFCQPAWARRLSVLAPFGRMALTHYLFQSVLGILLFYGVGLGIGPRWGMAGVLAAWLLLLGAQIWVSHVWLAHYRQGPLEWLWRWAAHGKRPPMRRSPY